MQTWNPSLGRLITPTPLTCSLRTTFPRKSSWPLSFRASLNILSQGEGPRAWPGQAGICSLPLATWAQPEPAAQPPGCTWRGVQAEGVPTPFPGRTPRHSPSQPMHPPGTWGGLASLFFAKAPFTLLSGWPWSPDSSRGVRQRPSLLCLPACWAMAWIWWMLSRPPSVDLCHSCRGRCHRQAL